MVRERIAAGTPAIMKFIKSKNTKPELFVRHLLRQLGFTGYRIHRKDLPGHPDIAFLGKRKAIFVHGCFWHRHDCKDGRKPKTNAAYWEPKIEKNLLRDKKHLDELTQMGWEALVLWQCELKDVDATTEKILAFMNE